MNQKTTNRTRTPFPSLVLIAACLLFLFQRVLLSATTVPVYSDSPRRYLLYTSMKGLVIVGVNLVPLWLGYHHLLIRRVNPLSKLAKYWLVYVLTLLSIFAFFFLLRNTLSIRDLWVILFPISQNVYSFAISFMVTFLLFPWLSNRLDHLTNIKVRRALFILTVAMVALPTIFSKDIWNINEGKNLVWQLYLVFFGYMIQRFNLLKKGKQIVPHLLLSVFVICGLILVMAKISMFLHGNTSTAERFSTPNSIFVIYYSVFLFLFLERIQAKIATWLPVGLVAIFLIVTQIITNNGLTTWSVYAYYRRPMAASLKIWGGWIVTFFFIYLGCAVILTVIFFFLSRRSLFRNVESKLSINSIDDFFSKLSNMWAWIKNRKRLFITTMVFYLLVIFQMYAVILVTTSSHSSVFFKNMLECQPQIILNVIIMWLIMIFIFLITNRFWYSAIFTTIFSIILTISSYLKISLRQEPVLPADMVMISNLGEIISMIQPTLLIFGLIIILFLAVGAYILQKRTRQKYNLKIGYKKRLIGIISLLVIFSGVFFINHQNTPPNLIFRLFKINNRFFNQPGGAQTNGPLVQFLVNIDVEVMKEPEGYSESRIQQIMKKYESVAKDINKERTEWSNDQVIIFNLSESFSDPSRMPETEVKKDPMPFIRNLIKENTSGFMLSSGYGGGTANMEWETLSGLSLSNLSPTLTTPYSQLVEKMEITPNITDLFDNKIAIHPYIAKLYNRIRVFDKFGFDAFYYVGSENKLEYTDKIPGSDYISDDSAFRETIKLINENSEGTQFIQLSSMQNHSPYTHEYPQDDYDFIGASVLPANAPLLRTYMQGMHYTDEAMKNFIAELDKIQKPITYVFYGDHLPGFYNGLDKGKYGLKMRETDYFVYNNAYSREHKKIDQPIVSPNMFSALALQQAGIKVTPYYAMLTDVLDNVPPTTTNPESSVNNKYNGGQVFVTPTGQMVEENELDENQRKIFEEYRMIQYDLTVGKQYSGKWALQKVN